MKHTVSEGELRALVGLHVSGFCDNGFVADKEEHCAHFVAHVMGYGFGATCRNMVFRPDGPGGNIRVQEIFPRCRSVGPWSGLPDRLAAGLVFIANPGNVGLAHKRMDAVRRLHVGIFVGPRRTIYHYSNTLRKVISQTPDEFSRHFPPPDNAMFWGEFV